MSNEDFFNQIARENIKVFAGSAVYNRGLNYFRDKRVELIYEEPENLHLHVQGSYNSEYCVDIFMYNGFLGYECTCPAYDSYGICKHIVAAFLFVQNMQNRRPHRPPQWQNNLDAALQTAQYYSKPSRKQHRRTALFLSLHKGHYGYGYALNLYRFDLSRFPLALVEGQDRIDTKALARYLLEHPELTDSKKAVDNVIKLNSANDINISPHLKSTLGLIVESSSYYHSTDLSTKLDVLRQFDVPIFTGNAQRPFSRLLTMLSDTAIARLDLTPTDDGLELSLKADVGDTIIDINTSSSEIFGTDPYWLKTNTELAKFSADYPHHLVAQLITKTPVTIAKQQKSFFVEHYLVPLMQHLPLGGTAVNRQKLNAPLEAKQLYIEEQAGDLAVTLHYKYGHMSLPHRADYPNRTTTLDEPLSNDDQLTLIEVKRDTEQEVAIYRATSSAKYGLKYAPKTSNETFHLRASVDPVDFLLKKLPSLVADGYEIFGEDNLKSVRVNRHKPTVSFNVSSGIDWFDIQTVIQFGEIPVDLKTVRQSLRQKQRFVKLADGSIGEIPEEWLQKYRHLFHLGEQDGNTIRLSSHHLMLVDQLLAEANQTEVDAQYRQRLQRLQSFEGIAERPLPQGFVGELRPYQKAGVNWLHFLNEFGFGGCLADDMGLGKTIQVLTLLQSLHEQDQTHSPSLIIMPRSLLANWEREAQRFTPNLKLITHFGNGRPKTSDHFTDANLILTTYGIVRRDLEMLRQYNFHYIVLDESQAIKNPNAKISKNVRLLQSQHRLVMTGTPVENSTFELWSQFAFLNPGLLGGVDYFKTEFSNPIERHNDQDAAELLRKMVYPFIMRRTKDQVALDLPPRSDRTIYVEMDSTQRKVYDKTRDDYRAKLLGLIEQKGMSGARFKMLEGLLRLRQISNHPKLVRDKYRGKSAKLELLLETLQTLHAEGHKALIFSQFVQMLHIIREEMDKMGLSYSYLDGSTRKRQDVVDAFQNDPDLTFFLISLKAGGVGLNLTAADYVIHVDPWWNPAVEMQASDRSHRIGQDKPVLVYKLITKDSVEEKILELQERKKKLVSQLITAEGDFLKQLTADDVQVLFS